MTLGRLQDDIRKTSGWLQEDIRMMSGRHQDDVRKTIERIDDDNQGCKHSSKLQPTHSTTYNLTHNGAWHCSTIGLVQYNKTKYVRLRLYGQSLIALFLNDYSLIWSLSILWVPFKCLLVLSECQILAWCSLSHPEVISKSSWSHPEVSLKPAWSHHEVVLRLSWSLLEDISQK